MSRLLVLLPLLAACGAPTETVWLEGFGYGWERFNHRLSYLSFQLGDDAAEVGVVGGTSTTGLNPALPDGCDEATCDEFPFFDMAPVTVDWARTTSRAVVVGTGSGEVVATAEGAAAEIPVTLDGRGKGEVVALVRGFSIDTDHELSGGPACYRPANGWHPRQIAISLGAPVLADDGGSASVPVSVTFVAGNSLEDERQCVDEVTAEARVPVVVDVVVVAGKKLEVATADLAHEVAYEYGNGPITPAEQAEPDWSTRSLSLSSEPTVVGWSAFDFRFHVDDLDQRGAYIRTLRLRADVDEGVAGGHATNYSPGTQLSGFDYAFSGTVVGLSFDAEVERGTAEGTLEELVDDAGAPVLLTLPL